MIRKIILFLMDREVFNIISDEKFLKWQYKLAMKKRLNLNDPQTFNEKLQWLKLNDRNDIYTDMVDKAKVKEYVSEKIGNKYIIPTLGIYDKFDDINFDELPNKFVIKCTHDSGGLVICKDKTKLDVKKTKKKVNHFLKRNYYYIHREWPYKNVEPRIIIEKYMEDNSAPVLQDYKFLCFNGEPKLIEIHQNRGLKNYTQDFYDVNWHKTSIANVGDPISKIEMKKPKNYDLMIEFSKKLSKDIPHIRVDWYEISGNLYFGELTLYDGAGITAFENYKDDLMLGSWIDLTKVRKEKK